MLVQRNVPTLGGLPRQWLCDSAKTIIREREGDAVDFERAIRFFKERSSPPDGFARSSTETRN